MYPRRPVRSPRAPTGVPRYEAWVYLKAEDRKLRKTFAGPGAFSAAKAWRQDAIPAARQNKLRGPSTLTVADYAAEFLAGARDGSIPNRSGDRYSPASVRGYERCLRLRVLPALGPKRLTDVMRADVQELRGGSSGVSVPVGGGVRVRLGQVRARSVVLGTQIQDQDSGVLSITSDRAVFVGARKTVECRWRNLVGLEAFSDAIRFNVSNRQTPTMLRLEPADAELAPIMASIAAQLASSN